MTFRKHRLAVLGLFLLATIGSIALATAQADTTAQWMLSSSDEVGPQLPLELSAKAEKALNLLSKIAGLKVEVSCEKISLDKVLLEAEGKGTGTLLFSGCRILLNGALAKLCEPHVGAEKGVIASNALKSQLVLHEGATLDRVEPVAGTTLATISTSEECAVGEKIPVIGVAYLKDGNGKFEVEEETHLVEEGPLTELWAISKTVEHKATIDGSAVLSLAGTHLHRWWSGLGA